MRGRMSRTGIESPFIHLFSVILHLDTWPTLPTNYFVCNFITAKLCKMTWQAQNLVLKKAAWMGMFTYLKYVNLKDARHWIGIYMTLPSLALSFPYDCSGSKLIINYCYGEGQFSLRGLVGQPLHQPLYWQYPAPDEGSVKLNNKKRNS